jgi:outer membrane protein OmpA-like peptidoglycan-associated protein
MKAPTKLMCVPDNASNNEIPPADGAKAREDHRDLNGEWQARFTLGGSRFKKERVMVRQIGDEIVATKITGDGFVPAGKEALHASYSGNPFSAEQLCALKDNANPQWRTITVRILDARHFKVQDGCSGNVTWERIGNPILGLESAILFDGDQSRLRPEAETTLAAAATFLNEHHPGAHLLVAGYTNDSGTERHNVRLSLQRAQSVAAWMQQHGVPQDRIRVQGFGSKKPRFPNINDEARSRNRRVEIEVLD